ncbi:MAG: M42 family metallopeptidase [Oscillospiraceae bacterium]|nr:M42 family metallopeptidase [Oscillospiraceae bacterium]
MKEYTEYAVEKAVELLGIDSPTGYTDEAANWVLREFAALGFDALKTHKGGVLADLGGSDRENGLLLAAHMDTLGAMVAEIKANGRLRIVSSSGLRANNAEAENCRIVTKFSGAYEGTFQICNASVHVNDDYNGAAREFDHMEVLLDELVGSAQDVRALGIEVGDFACFEPRTRVTEKGYIKSRYLDDKLSVGILLGFAKYLRDTGAVPARRIYVHITAFEEVGHGASGSIPAGVTEAISVDMGCVGDGLRCSERQVSICAKDSRGPYHYDVVKGLIAAARQEEADYAVDIYPHYGSDVEAALSAGYDVRHGLIGPGVYASHGYERSHQDGVLNTLKILKGYLL